MCACVCMHMFAMVHVMSENNYWELALVLHLVEAGSLLLLLLCSLLFASFAGILLSLPPISPLEC